MRDATSLSRLTTMLLFYFNPRVPCGTRPNPNIVQLWDRIFQSTRPMRDATNQGQDCTRGIKFQSTRPMRDATRMDDSDSVRSIISIHASHAGRDSDIHKFKSLFKTFLMLSQQNFALLVTKSDFTTNKTMFILCKLGVIIKTASSSH